MPLLGLPLSYCLAQWNFNSPVMFAVIKTLPQIISCHWQVTTSTLDTKPCNITWTLIMMQLSLLLSIIFYKRHCLLLSIEIDSDFPFYHDLTCELNFALWLFKENYQQHHLFSGLRLPTTRNLKVMMWDIVSFKLANSFSSIGMCEVRFDYTWQKFHSNSGEIVRYGVERWDDVAHWSIRST